MTSVVRIPPVALAVVALHTAVLPHLRIFGVGADVMMLTSIAAGLVAGPRTGAWVGFWAGMIADSFTRTPFGLSAFTYCLIAYGVGLLRVGVLQMSWWVPPAVTFGASVMGTLTFVSLGTVLGQEYLWSQSVLAIALVMSALNTALGPFVVSGVRWALTKESHLERRRS